MGFTAYIGLGIVVFVGFALEVRVRLWALKLGFGDLALEYMNVGLGLRAYCCVA